MVSVPLTGSLVAGKRRPCCAFSDEEGSSREHEQTPTCTLRKAGAFPGTHGGRSSLETVESQNHLSAVSSDRAGRNASYVRFGRSRVVARTSVRTQLPFPSGRSACTGAPMPVGAKKAMAAEQAGAAIMREWLDQSSRLPLALPRPQPRVILHLSCTSLIPTSQVAGVRPWGL